MGSALSALITYFFLSQKTGIRKPSFLLHHQDRAGSLPDDPLGDAAHEQPLKPGAAMAAHDDQVNPVFQGYLDDAFVGRQSLGRDALKGNPFPVGRSQ